MSIFVHYWNSRKRARNTSPSGQILNVIMDENVNNLMLHSILGILFWENFYDCESIET